LAAYALQFSDDEQDTFIKAMNLGGEGVGFSKHLSAAALIWACTKNPVYSARNQAIYMLVLLYTRGTRADMQALLDSGATENFIHPEMVARYQLTMVPLKKPRKVKNVDGTMNKVGAIKYVVSLCINFGQTSQVHNFLVADLGPDRIILGYPFFENTDPSVDWHGGMLPRIVQLAAPDCVLLRRTTMASELAQAAQDKQVRTWQELVPTYYHQFKKVFSKEASNCFPT
jgi:hypothetical protein